MTEPIACFLREVRELPKFIEAARSDEKRKAAPLLHRGEAGARRKSALFRVQQDEPLNGPSVGFRFGLDREADRAIRSRSVA
jgi:hypothetical protein